MNGSSAVSGRRGPSPVRLAVNGLEEELADVAAFCRREAVGLEVTAFAYPSNLDEGLRARIERHAEAVAGVAPLFCHGPFLDLYPTSPDPRVASLARDRHLQGIEAAAAMGADGYVAHLNSIPLIRNRDYRTRFVPAAADFWSALADRAGESGTTIVLENLWESGPELQKRVVTHAGHPHLKASFDNGHALVFSTTSAAEWIGELGADLAHVHVHDNDGTYDQHLPVGDGIEDWEAVVRALRAHAPQALVVTESDRLAANRESLRAFREILGAAGAPPPWSGA